VLGYVNSTDLLRSCLAGEEHGLRRFLLEPLIVPETISILVLLDRFRSSETHLAAVLDEYGGFAGLATLNDILEELVGEMMPETPGASQPVVQLADGSWSISGALRVREFLEVLALDNLDLSAGGFHTVGGFVTTQLGRLPRVGDSFVWQGFRVVVTAMAELRVERISVVRE
jgi:putative hemolysin